MDTGPGIQRIEEQLDDLLSMLGCPDRDKRPAAPPAMSPLDRLVRTQPIWHCPEVTREEAVTLLHNKKEGNFLVRGSRQPGTLALSVRLSPSSELELELPSVQHFIILARGGGRVALEDSDLVFDNIVSLAFHYTQVCEELPSRLSLPAVLATATSTQNLASLALLGKSFWSYPMAACSRASVCGDTGDMETMANNSNNNNNYNGGPLTRTPPRPPNRARSSSQPQAQGGAGVPRSRRNSDSAPFIMSVARVQPTRPARHSLGSLYPAAEWVSSPVWASSGRHSPPAPAARSRKVSVFYNKLGHVSEAGEEDTREGEECSSDLTSTDEEEADYAFPLDAVTEENSEHSIYENPHVSSSQADTRTDIVMEPLSPLDESDEGGDTESSPGDTFSQSHSHNNNSNHSSISNSSNTGSSERRKLSLGVILRKLSSGSQHQPAAAAKERKTSLQEKRLSTAISKLITPIFERRSLGMSESYQVNSSSWEFLNQEPQDKVLDKVQDKVQGVQEVQEVQGVQGKVLGKHPSTDSLYESEFESSSTLESAHSTHSRLHTSAVQQC